MSDWVIAKSESDWNKFQGDWVRFKGEAKEVIPPKEYPFLVKLTYNYLPSGTEMVHHFVTIGEALLLLEASGAIKLQKPDENSEKKENPKPTSKKNVYNI